MDIKKLFVYSYSDKHLKLKDMTTTKTWIPKSNELVKWNGKLFTIISCDLGGKCKIKAFTTTRRITKKFSDIDVSELQKA